MNKKIIYIKGMHCRSCELLIEEAIRKIRAVVDVKVSYRNDYAEIYSKKVIDDKIIHEAIIKAGYGLGKNDIFEFTPTLKGSYNITCAMGVPRGILVVE